MSWRWPTIATAAIVAGALFPQAPLRDAETMLAATEVTLAVPLTFLVLSPICRLLDAVMLLGAHQHYALVGTIVMGALAWRGARWAWRRPCRAAHEVWLLCGAVPAAILGVYALGLFAKPPPLSLRVADPHVVVVDFHSHTNFSWDGRGSFTVERNRAWHRAAGWNVAYITDHTTLAGAAQAIAVNPRRAGDDTVVLPAVETRRTHFVVLGMTEEDWRVLRYGNRTSLVPYDPRHVVILTIPSALERLARREYARIGPLLGIELSDADPRGLMQGQLERAELLDVADRQGLAVVASSNNHGWTSTPVAWSLLRIPGWRDLAPEALDLAIQDRVRTEGRRAVRIVERYAADVPQTLGGLAATVPAIAWHVLATLTPTERFVWLAWAWTLPLVVACFGAARRRAEQ